MLWLKYDDNYSVCENGQVKNIQTQRILKPWYRGKYLAVNLGANNKHYVHHLIAETFLPKTLDGYTEIDHIDRNKENNSAHNLRWVDKKTNSLNKAITIKARKNNSGDEHHIYFNGYSFYVNIQTKDLKVRKKFENKNDAIIYRNKIIAEINGV